MDTLWKKQDIVTRSISAENPTGAKGMGGMATIPADSKDSHHARELGQGWKVNPFMKLEANTETTIAHIKVPGMIKHIWLAPLDRRAIRSLVIRMYWDGADKPAVEAPIGDFFASANLEYWQINSIFICRNPKTGYNCYFDMPFKKECKITVENLNSEHKYLGFQIDYEEREIPDDALYFHAQFYRSNPLPYKENYVILDKIHGKGAFIGTYMVWGITNNGWWGEGEIKFFLDGDDKFPSICGTGTEDYFCGSFNFDVEGKYQEFSSPYTGFYSWKSDDLYQPAKRFSMYRWHANDPIYFAKDIRITIQALGWRSNSRYLPLQSADISSVAYFYIDTPCVESRPLPDADGLELI